MTAMAQFKDGIRAQLIDLTREQILETIYESALTPNSGTGAEEVEALKQEYNRLSYELERLKYVSPMDPLARLPPEVWTEIIRETAEENGVNLPPTAILLLLTLVSREWSREIVDMPLLWTHITIGRGKADAQAKLASALHLTGHLKFEITINVPPYRWEDELSLLRAHVQYLKKITFKISERGNFYNAIVEGKYIDDLFASLGHLPSLRVFRGPFKSPLSWDGVFERCPKLTYVYGAILPLETFQTRNPVPIRACHVEAPWHDIIPYLGNISHLEELEWTPWLDTEVDIGGKRDSLPSLPALRRVSGNLACPSNILTLLRLTERLTWLRFRIGGNWQYLKDFLLLLEHLCHLQDLGLDLEYIEEKISFPVNRLAKTGVQYLRLSGRTTTRLHPGMGPSLSHARAAQLSPTISTHFQNHDFDSTTTTTTPPTCSSHKNSRGKLHRATTQRRPVDDQLHGGLF